MLVASDFCAIEATSNQAIRVIVREELLCDLPELLVLLCGIGRDQICSVEQGVRSAPHGADRVVRVEIQVELGVRRLSVNR